MLKMKLKKYLWCICAVVHWLLGFYSDAFIFKTNNVDTKFIVLKLIYLISLIILWYAILGVVSAAKAGNVLIRASLKHGIRYWIILSIIMFCIWPGNWIWDDFFIFIDATYLQFTPWQHILTSVFYILSLMLLPFAAGVVIVQYTIIACIAGMLLGMVDIRLHNKKNIYYLYIPFLLFPVLSHNLYPLRLSMYSFLEVAFFSLIYFESKSNEKLSKRIMAFLILANILLSTWRSEGIFFLVLGPILLYIAVGKRLKKHICLGILFTICISSAIIMQIQNNSMGDRADHYGLTGYVESFDDLIKYEYTINPDGAVISTLENLIDIDFLVTCNSGERAFWDGAFQNVYLKEEYDILKQTYIELVKKYPAKFLAERIETFLITSGCSMESRPFVGLSKEQLPVPEFLTDYQATTPINSELRIMILNILSGRNSSFTGMTVIGRAFYNIIPPLVCLIYFFFLSIKKKYLLGVGICGTILLHWSLVFIAAPGIYFMYYLPIYIAGYVLAGFMFAMYKDSLYCKGGGNEKIFNSNFIVFRCVRNRVGNRCFRIYYADFGRRIFSWLRKHSKLDSGYNICVFCKYKENLFK